MKHSLLYIIALCAAAPAMAQKSATRYLLHGNRAYRDSTFDKAEVLYLKAQDLDERFAPAHYNAGCAMLMQNKAKEAMESYEEAVKREKDKSRLASIYHNMGWIMQASKQYADAIECYKNALRNNPQDDETRYNLVLCQRLLKNQPQDNQNQDQQQDKQDQQQQQQQQDEQNQDQQQQEPQPQEQKENEMSRENAEQMLQAAMQDEKKTQDKMQQQAVQPSRRRLQKQW